MFEQVAMCRIVNDTLKWDSVINSVI